MLTVIAAWKIIKLLVYITIIPLAVGRKIKKVPKPSQVKTLNAEKKHSGIMFLYVCRRVFWVKRAHSVYRGCKQGRGRRSKSCHVWKHRYILMYLWSGKHPRNPWGSWFRYWNAKKYQSGIFTKEGRSLFYATQSEISSSSSSTTQVTVDPFSKEEEQPSGMPAFASQRPVMVHLAQKRI